MNAEQRTELLDRIADIAGEHCQGYVFIAQVEPDEEEQHDNNETYTISSYDGGSNLALGMVKRMEARLVKRMISD